MSAHRVASLLPSATEIVAALGAGDRLIARSHECDYPVDVTALPAVTAARTPVDRPGADIDRAIRSLIEQALSIYRVDAELLRGATPDLIITQTLCDVCAVSPRDVEEALAGWTGARPHVLALAPAALADVFADIARVAAALGREREGAALTERMRARMAAIAERCADAPRPRVACIEWIEPLMSAGNWIPEMIAMAGGENLFGHTGEHSPWLAYEALAAAAPDIVLVFPCGFDLARTRREMGPFISHPLAPKTRVYLIDGNQYLNRPGPRLADSLEILAEILHPELFAFGHEGAGWMRFA